MGSLKAYINLDILYFHSITQVFSIRVAYEYGALKKFIQCHNYTMILVISKYTLLIIAIIQIYLITMVKRIISLEPMNLYLWK